MKSGNLLKRLFIGLAVILILIQLIPVSRTNPPVTAEIDAPAEVMAVFQRSCYDCHSNETNWRWYSYIAPVSWLTARDVKEAREHLNFSEWGNLEAKKQAKKAEEIWEEVSEDNMPMKIYVLVHPEAKLSRPEKAALQQWAMAVQSLQGERGESQHQESGEENEHEH